MKLLIFQKGFQYSRDGCGNRLVYHLQGCNLHCPWCANPEGISPEPVLMQKAYKIPNWVCPDFNRDKCKNCRNQLCLKRPNMYLIPSSREYEVTELIDEAVSCKSMFFDGGGVTLTGGEVCMQAAAAAELLSGLQKKGIHTVIETNASLPVLSKLLSHSDCVIADYKHYNGSVLHEVTGAMLNTVEHNIIKIIERKIELHLRIPLIHGFNDTDTDGFIKSLARLSSYGAYNVELLPYHEYGRDKWRECGLKYGIKDGFVSPEFILKLKTALMDAGIKVIST